MRVLITRPEREATALAGALGERGHTVILAPLFGLQILHPPAGFEAALAASQAILLSSANGARALAEASPQRSRPVLTVGDTTAATAEGLGFTQVTSAAGDGAALAELVRARLDPKAGPLLHVAGQDVAFDFAAALQGDGFEVHRFALYEAREADRLPDSGVAALQARAVDVATFFSPRAAALFVRLVRDAGLAEQVGDVAAVAISPAALAPLAELPFKSASAAARPTRQAVLDEVDRLAAAGVQQQASPMSEPTPPPPAAETPTLEVRRGPSLAVAFAMGMLGAVIVLAAALATLNMWPPQLRALWRGPAVAPAPSTQGVDTAALRREIGDLARANAEATRTALTERLNDLDKRLTTLAASATGRGGNERPTTASDPALGDLRSRVEALESRPAAAPAPAVAAATPETEKEIAGLTREIDSLRAALQTLNQSVATQRDQAKSLGEAIGARGITDQKLLATARASAVVAIAVRLSNDLDLGAPFADDLALLGPLLPGDATLDGLSKELQPFAQTGVASRAVLAAEFPAVAKEALAEDLADDSLGQRVLGKLRGLVSLRRVGDVPGEEVEARLARAEVAIKAGDLAKAVELVAALPPAVGKATGDWLKRAQAHLAAERAIARLSAHAVQLLAAAR